MDESVNAEEALIQAFAITKQLRDEGWLVAVKLMPNGFSFLSDDENWKDQPKLYTCVYCSLSWMPTNTLENIRKRIWYHPHGWSDTTPIEQAYLEAITKAAAMAHETRED